MMANVILNAFPVISWADDEENDTEWESVLTVIDNLMTERNNSNRWSGVVQTKGWLLEGKKLSFYRDSDVKLFEANTAKELLDSVIDDYMSYLEVWAYKDRIELHVSYHLSTLGDEWSIWPATEEEWTIHGPKGE